MGQGIAHRPVIMRVSYDLRGDLGGYYRRRPPTKGVGLHVADSHTGNHPEDDFTPLETIRRSYSVIREKIMFDHEGETFKPEGGGGLRVADSHTGNHPKDDFTPLETIRRSYSVIREKIMFDHEGETFKPEGGG
nr:hypothetical protein [Tanacetum cinerariifolium]